MQIKIYGTRGSYPVSRPTILRYGGNTTCVYIEEGDCKVIIDAGTGISKLGQDLHHGTNEQMDVHMLLTHAHWDHIMGLPYFVPFFKENYKFTFYGSGSETMQLQELIGKTMDGYHNFPVRFEELKSTIDFHPIKPNENIDVNCLKISTYQLNHPGTDLGYRIESEKGTFVILTDLAPIEDNHLGMGMKEKSLEDPKGLEQEYTEGLVEFIRGADLIMHDTNFTEEEIVDKRHWGHSTPEDALKLVSHLDNPPAIMLSHHDPNHTDEDMQHIYETTRRKGRKQRTEVLIAKEGGRFIL